VAAAASLPAPPSTSSSSPISIGTHVKFHGFKAKPELNRQHGESVGFNASSGRCEVKFWTTGEGPAA
jgi:hypothetical protein